uniref:Uncharacterized protein n=1 Tax=Mastacembelus armatus TaxID=205130 RepID=A0A7N8YGD3_9TELE
MLKIRRGAGSQLHYSFYELQSWNHSSACIWFLTNPVHHTNIKPQSSRVRTDFKRALGRKSSTFIMHVRRMGSGCCLPECWLSVLS